MKSFTLLNQKVRLLKDDLYVKFVNEIVNPFLHIFDYHIEITRRCNTDDTRWEFVKKTIKQLRDQGIPKSVMINDFSAKLNIQEYPDLREYIDEVYAIR